MGDSIQRPQGPELSVRDLSQRDRGGITIDETRAAILAHGSKDEALLYPPPPICDSF